MSRFDHTVNACCSNETARLYKVDGYVLKTIINEKNNLSILLNGEKLETVVNTTPGRNYIID